MFVRLKLCDTLPVPWAPQVAALCQMTAVDKGIQKAQGAGRMDSIKKAPGEKEGKLLRYPNLYL